MPMRREQVAAALEWLGSNANPKERLRRLTSLDQPTDSDAVDMAIEMGGSVIPGVGQALAARDFERARRADDPAGMAMAGASAFPLGRLAGALKRYDPVMRELDVYHGTPHRFPSTETNPLGEFDASKINTGEGAQAYGHGIYLAESPAVAKGYRSQLSPGTITTIDGKDYDSANPEHVAAKYLQMFRKRNYPPEKIANILEEDARLLEQEGHKKAAEIVRTANIEKLGTVGHRKSGALYTADLPDEMVDRMLDWDKPLSEQRELATPILKELGYLRANDNGPRQFAQAVKALGIEHGEFGEGNINGMALFKAIYKGLEQGKPKAIEFAKRMNLGEQGMFMEASPLASEVMKRMGIPGIKYLDAGSRGQGGSGTRNFVVFPGEEKKLKILKRE